MKPLSYLALEGITATFPTRSGPFTAIKDISLSIEKGEFVALSVADAGVGIENRAGAVAADGR